MCKPTGGGDEGGGAGPRLAGTPRTRWQPPPPLRSEGRGHGQLRSLRAVSLEVLPANISSSEEINKAGDISVATPGLKPG